MAAQRDEQEVLHNVKAAKKGVARKAKTGGGSEKE
jgi:hypothetical protein